MALCTDKKLRFGVVYFGESRDPEALEDHHLTHGLAAAYDPGVEGSVQIEEIKTPFKEYDIVIAETGSFSINIREPAPARREQNTSLHLSSAGTGRASGLPAVWLVRVWSWIDR